MGKLYLYITWVSWYQKGKTNLDFNEARESVAVASAGPIGADTMVHMPPTFDLSWARAGTDNRYAT